MTDRERIAHLERSLQRLRLFCGLGLVGLATLAAAPVASGKLTASELVLKGDGRTVTLTPFGLEVQGPSGTARLGPAELRVARDNLAATVSVDTNMASVGVAVDEQTTPSSASLRVMNVKGQDPSPQLLVADPKQMTSVMAGTQFKR
ncbi:MAG: hypothetical protein U0228_01900 [Myxococcaceae bacterium]